MTTNLFQRMNAAEAAYKACDATDFDRFFDLLNAWEAAENAYHTAISHAALWWDGIPKGQRKDSAEQNAFDTEGTDIDRLHWFDIARRSYDV